MDLCPKLRLAYPILKIIGAIAWQIAMVNLCRTALSLEWLGFRGKGYRCIQKFPDLYAEHANGKWFGKHQAVW